MPRAQTDLQTIRALRLRLLTTGGTIAAAAPHAQGLADVLDDMSYLSSTTPGPPCEGLEVVEVTRAFSHEFGLHDLLAIGDAVTDAIGEGVDGIVVAHGTDTLEETAYMLALSVERSVPVVLTGSMRTTTDLGSDGPANLRDALTVASSPAAGQLGPVVVFGNEIHCARWVSKVHATKLGAFASPGVGPVGEIWEDGAHVWLHPSYEDYVGRPGHSLSELRVALIRVTVGAPALRPDHFDDGSLDGIVIEALGGGHVPHEMVAAIDAALAADIPVVTCARSVASRTLNGSYLGLGTSADLKARGVVHGGALSGNKARLRLLVGLDLGIDPSILFPVD